MFIVKHQESDLLHSLNHSFLGQTLRVLVNWETEKNTPILDFTAWRPHCSFAGLALLPRRVFGRNVSMTAVGASLIVG